MVYRAKPWPSGTTYSCYSPARPIRHERHQKDPTDRQGGLLNGDHCNCSTGPQLANAQRGLVTPSCQQVGFLAVGGWRLPWPVRYMVVVRMRAKLNHDTYTMQCMHRCFAFVLSCSMLVAHCVFKGREGNALRTGNTGLMVLMVWLMEASLSLLGG